MDPKPSFSPTTTERNSSTFDNVNFVVCELFKADNSYIMPSRGGGRGSLLFFLKDLKNGKYPSMFTEHTEGMACPVYYRYLPKNVDFLYKNVKLISYRDCLIYTFSQRMPLV